MKKLLVILLLLVITFSGVLSGCTPTEEPTTTPQPTATPEPTEKPLIKLSELNWGSAQFQTAMAKIMIEEGYGYPVETIAGGTIMLTQGLRNQDIDVYIEIWLQNQQEAMDQALDAGDIEILSTLNNDNWQSCFVVPNFVVKGDAARGIEPMLPNLKKVEDLLTPEAMALFKNPENTSKGLIMNGPPGWECEIILGEQVKVYGLADSYDIGTAGSSEMLFASLQGAYDKGEPWLGYCWGPAWVSGALDLTLLEEPPYDAEIFQSTRACAWPSVDLLVAVHKDFRANAPDVTAMFEKWRMDTATLDAVLAYMHDTEANAAETAVWFLKNSEELWTPFVPADVAAKIKAAVAGM